MTSMNKEMEQHLKERLLPFWKNLKDDLYGGFYGLMGTDLKIVKEAEKGCILNSRILCFFSNAYLVLRQHLKAVLYLDAGSASLLYLQGIFSYRLFKNIKEGGLENEQNNDSY